MRGELGSAPALGFTPSSQPSPPEAGERESECHIPLRPPALWFDGCAVPCQTLLGGICIQRGNKLPVPGSYLQTAQFSVAIQVLSSA